ncbi:MAG: hypothetical protein PVF58_07320 [Candidatus Methanofastidiosia archaeon]|jgi:hypothetical protein
MMPTIFGLGILIMILGIAAFFIPSLTRIINFPGNEKIKAIVALIIGIVLTIYGYLSG